MESLEVLRVLHPELVEKYRRMCERADNVKIYPLLPRSYNRDKRLRTRTGTWHQFLLKIQKIVKILTQEDLDKLERAFYISRISKDGKDYYDKIVMMFLFRFEKLYIDGMVDLEYKE